MNPADADLVATALRRMAAQDYVDLGGPPGARRLTIDAWQDLTDAEADAFARALHPHGSDQ